MNAVYNTFSDIGGADALPLKFDMPDEELYPFLDSINGVIMTGGALLLYDTVTGLKH